jgi:hypothetical protein
MTLDHITQRKLAGIQDELGIVRDLLKTPHDADTVSSILQILERALLDLEGIRTGRETADPTKVEADREGVDDGA